MTRRGALSLVALLMVTFGMRTTVLAHPGHDHKVVGTVTMAASDHVMVKDKDNKDVTVHINAATRVVQARKPMRVEDIKAGMRVAITAVTVKEKDAEVLMAKTIELGVTPTTR